MQSTPQTTSQTPGAKPEAPKRPPRPVPPPEFQAGDIMKLDEPALIEILKDSSAPAFRKAKACQRLASVGTKEAVAPLAALLADPQLSHYGRYGLETNPDASADDALRAALPKLKGALRVGAINSIAQRKDAKAVPVLAKLIYGADLEAARAAAAALGRIGGPQAAAALRTALGQAKPALRPDVAAAALVCAEGMLESSRAEALALYDTLTRPAMPKPVRLAAMRGIIGAETALSRPR